jgi:hypothetical protein
MYVKSLFLRGELAVSSDSADYEERTDFVGFEVVMKSSGM